MSQRAKKVIFCLSTLVILLVVFSVFFLRLLFSPTPGRTNILLLGVAGKGHRGGDLTDTIIFVSVDNPTAKVLAISLPRDIWIAPLKTKLNSLYHYGGLSLVKSTVGEILGQPIDYVVLIDFDSFVKAIDVLGGVEVEVERSFDDYRYPIAGRENDPCGGDPEYKCRYEHLHFDAGKQHMDGQRALKYVRSRFAEGEEGTDFARAKRQQRLLLAIKNKVISPQMLFDPRKSLQLFKVLTSSFKTDIPKEKYRDLLRLGLRFRPQNLKMYVLGEDYLLNPPPSQYENQWVLVPRAGNWEEVQRYVTKLLND